MPKRFNGKIVLPTGPAAIKRKLQHAQSISLNHRKKPVSLAPIPESKRPPKGVA